MTRICALNGWKLILAKTVPFAVESFTAYTCSSYYRRSIRTSLSSLQSHVLTSLWSNSYAIWKTGGTAPGFRRHLHRWSETTSFRFFFALVAIHKFTHKVRRIKVVVVLSSFWLREWAYGQQQARKNRKLIVSDQRCKLSFETYSAVPPVFPTVIAVWLWPQQREYMTLQRRQWSAYPSMIWYRARVGPYAVNLGG